MPVILVALAIVARVQEPDVGPESPDLPQEFLEAMEMLSDPEKSMEKIVERSERFRLYTGCSRLWLWVDAFGDDAETIGLTRGPSSNRSGEPVAVRAAPHERGTPGGIPGNQTNDRPTLSVCLR